MDSTFEFIRADQFCRSVRDGTHDSPKRRSQGPSLITSRHIIGGSVDLQNAYSISREDFEAINRRSEVERWDVLISMIGTVGEPCLIREEPNFAIKNVGLFKTRGELEGKWLYYYLLSPDARNLIRANSRGTTQPYVPLHALRELPVPVPKNRKLISTIVEILGALDDKIDLNRQMDETLETMARALYRSWFVDFDPVVAKAAGKHPFGMDDATAALFPDRFVDSELGPIPEGWRAGVLRNVGELRYGKSLPANRRNAGHTLVVGSNGPVGAHDEYLVSGPGIVIGRKGTAGAVTLVRQNFWPIDTTFYFAPEAPESVLFSYYLLNELDLPALSGDSAVPGLNRDTAYQAKTAIPPLRMIEAYEPTVRPWFDLIGSHQGESQTLARLRDLLLPKLLSGEIRVNDAEKAVQEVV